jgi:hypothetical protein
MDTARFAGGRQVEGGCVTALILIRMIGSFNGKCLNRSLDAAQRNRGNYWVESGDQTGKSRVAKFLDSASFIEATPANRKQTWRVNY